MASLLALTNAYGKAKKQQDVQKRLKHGGSSPNINNCGKSPRLQRKGYTVSSECISGKSPRSERRSRTITGYDSPQNRSPRSERRSHTITGYDNPHRHHHKSHTPPQSKSAKNSPKTSRRRTQTIDPLTGYYQTTVTAASVSNLVDRDEELFMKYRSCSRYNVRRTSSLPSLPTLVVTTIQ